MMLFSIDVVANGQPRPSIASRTSFCNPTRDNVNAGNATTDFAFLIRSVIAATAFLREPSLDFSVRGRTSSARVTIGRVRCIEFVRTADPLDVWIAIDRVTDGKGVVPRHAETVLDALISNSLDDIVNYRCRFCSHHFFLKLSKIDVSENPEGFCACTFWRIADQS